MSALRARERTNDIHHWVKTFLKATGAFNGGLTSSLMEPLTIAHFEKWIAGMLTKLLTCDVTDNYV